MARDPETIQREIEKARDALATTLDQLGEKANPQRAMDVAKTSAQAKLDDPKIKYTLIGVGAVVGLLLVRKLLR